MLKGSALFVVIVISLIIGILCSSLIFISYYQRLQVQNDLLIKKLDLNATSGLNLLLSNSDIINYDEERYLDLYGEERDSIFLKRIHWGIFDIGIAKAFTNNHSHVKIAQYGYKPTHFSKSAIYLTDQNRPLSIAGNTLIKGDCYLPVAGIRKGYIEGQSYFREEMVAGNVKASNTELPELNKKIIERIFAILKGSTKLSNQSASSLEGDTVDISFLDAPMIISSQSSIIIDQRNYKGQVIFYSAKSITVPSNARLDNVLLFAPSIKVEENFKGRLQAFATDSLVIGDNCNLIYPSALGLIKKNEIQGQPFVRIEDNTSIKGIIFTHAYNPNEMRQTLITIHKNSEVEGQVFGTGYVELYGRVYGNVSCNRFRLRTNSSGYDNHLWNAEIDYSKLSPYFIGSELLMSEKERKVIAWLN